MPTNPEENREFVDPDYAGWIQKVMTANSSFSEGEAYAAIKKAEGSYSYALIDPFDTNPPETLESRRRELGVFADLNIISSEQNIELSNVQDDFSKAVKEVASAKGMSEIDAQKAIGELVLYEAAKNFNEAKEMICNGPVVTGFETTEDPGISDMEVRNFVLNSFSEEIIDKIKLAKISKNDSYLIYSGRPKLAQAKDLLKRGVITQSAEKSYGLFQATDKNRYLEAALELEGVKEVGGLRHIYKVRSEAGLRDGYAEIKLRSFGVEDMSDYDYLSGLEISSDDKRIIFMLGTLAHEIAHRVDHMFLKPEHFEEYKLIVDEEVGLGRKKFVSDYALRHAEFYQTAERGQLGEDFAETVRIFVTNADFLKGNFPRRFVFIQRICPFLIQNGAQLALKKKQS